MNKQYAIVIKLIPDCDEDIDSDVVIQELDSMLNGASIGEWKIEVVQPIETTLKDAINPHI